jgi:hypothetical protein
MSAFETPQKQVIQRSSLVCPPPPARQLSVSVDALHAPMRSLNLNHTALVMPNEATFFMQAAIPRTPERVRAAPVCPGAPTNKARLERLQSSSY